MTRRAIHFLFAASTALLLSTTACGGDKGKADAGKADAGKADDGKADAGDTAAGDTAAGDTAAEGDTAAGETGGAEAGAETGAGDTAGGETGGAEGEDGETGEAAAEGGDEGTPAAGDGDDGDDGDKGDDGDDKKDGGTKTAEAPKLDGKPIFLKKCKSCHGVDGKGDTTIGKKVDIPSLAKTKLGKAKIVGIVTKGVDGTKMKAYKDKLSKDEIDAVAAYVKKL